MAGSELGNLFQRDPVKIFMVLPDMGRELIIRLAQTLIKHDTFVNRSPLYQSLRAFLVRKNLPEGIKGFINRWSV